MNTSTNSAAALDSQLEQPVAPPAPLEATPGANWEVMCSSAERGKHYLLIRWTPTQELASWHGGAFNRKKDCIKEAKMVRTFLTNGEKLTRGWWRQFRKAESISKAVAGVYFTV